MITTYISYSQSFIPDEILHHERVGEEVSATDFLEM